MQNITNKETINDVSYVKKAISWKEAKRVSSNNINSLTEKCLWQAEKDPLQKLCLPAS
jgi:hypothetical protein